jgi:hypothetical protein
VPAPGAGTIDDLIGDARKAGYTVTRRLVADWVSEGLLDKPTRTGAGRGKGTTKRVFSPGQRELFLDLVKERAKNTRLAPLTNIPVALWLYSGEDDVPLRQVKRVLKTWIQAADRPIPARSRLATQKVVDLIASPDARDTHKTRLLRLLDEANRVGRVDDPAALRKAIELVFDPDRTGRTLGPPGVRVTPEILVCGMVLNSRALKALREESVDDQVFERARADLRQNLTNYIADHPQLIEQAEGSLQRLLSIPLLQQYSSNACGDLLTAIVHQLTEEDRP